MMDDTELLRRYAVDRSEEAFAELVRRHLGLVYGVALRKVGGDAHLAQDVTQGVFTDLARKAPVLAQRTVLTGWLFTSTHYAAAKVVRAAQRRRTHEQEAQLMNELTSSDPAAAIDWERLRPALDDLIGELDERDREAVLLRFIDGRDFAGVGAKLNLSPDGARSRVERAVEKIRASLARRGVTSTAAALGLVLANQAGGVMAPAGLAASVTSAALAGAGGTAAGVSTFMSITKLTLGIGAAAAGVAGLVVQQQANAQLRNEIASLREESHAMADLRAKNERLTKAADESAFEVTSLLNAVERLRTAQKAAAEQAKAPQPAATGAFGAGSYTGVVTVNGGTLTLTSSADGPIVVGAVKQPGPVSVSGEGGLSVVDAIARAGGASGLADLKRVTVKRANADGTMRVWVVDVQAQLKGRPAERFQLQPKDVILVPERTL